MSKPMVQHLLDALHRWPDGAAFELAVRTIRERHAAHPSLLDRLDRICVDRGRPDLAGTSSADWAARQARERDSAALTLNQALAEDNLAAAREALRALDLADLAAGSGSDLPLLLAASYGDRRARARLEGTPPDEASLCSTLAGYRWPPRLTGRLLRALLVNGLSPALAAAVVGELAQAGASLLPSDAQVLAGTPEASASHDLLHALLRAGRRGAALETPRQAASLLEFELGLPEAARDWAFPSQAAALIHRHALWPLGRQLLRAQPAAAEPLVALALMEPTGGPPDDVRASLLAEACVEAGRGAEAPHFLLQASPDFLVSRNGLRMIRQLGRALPAERAVQLFTRLLRLLPGQPDIVLLLAEKLSELRRHEAVVALLGPALRDAPDPVLARLLGRSLLRLRLYGEVPALAEAFAPGTAGVAELHRMTGDAQAAQQRWEEARAAYGRALVGNPKDMLAMFSLARVRARLGEREAAISDLASVVALAQNRDLESRALVQRGGLLIRLGRYDEALADLDAAEERGVDPRRLKEQRAVSREMRDGARAARPSLGLLAADPASLDDGRSFAEVVPFDPAAADSAGLLAQLRALRSDWVLVAPRATSTGSVGGILARLTDAARRRSGVIAGHADPLHQLRALPSAWRIGLLTELLVRELDADPDFDEAIIRRMPLDGPVASPLPPFPAPMPPLREMLGGRRVVLMSRHGIELFGGGEHFLRSMVPLYRAFGMEPVIVGMKQSRPVREGVEDGIPFVDLPEDMHELTSLLLRMRPAVVHCLSGLGHQLASAVDGLDIRVIYGVHFWRDVIDLDSLASYNEVAERGTPDPLFPRLLNTFDCIYANSEYVAAVLQDHFDFMPSSLPSLPSDIEGQAPAGEASGYVLVVNASAAKQGAFLLDVARLLPHRRFVGLAHQNALDAALPPNFELRPPSEDMQALYRDAACVLVPSFETFSRVVIEAHRLARPVIGAPWGNVPNLLRESGIVVELDPARWAAEIDRLYDEPAHYAALSRRALENSARYAFAHQQDRLAGLLAGMLRPALVAVGAGLGNIVQTTPLIRRAASASGERIDVLINEPFYRCHELLGGAAQVGSVFTTRSLPWRKCYESAVITHSFGSVIPRFNAEAVHVARDVHSWEETREIHEAEFNLRSARVLVGLDYPAADAARYFVGPYVGQRTGGLIGFHAGSKDGWAPKNWPYYPELARRLRGLGHEVVSFGAAHEAVPGTTDWTGTPLRETIRRIAGLRAMVANDSGIMHIADGLRIPLVTLFAPTSVVKNGPLSPTSHVVALSKSCAPCQFDPDRFANCRCIGEIGVDEVLEAVLALFEPAA
jgi:tetratricopeptide (TPR) repeat protein